jgi:hypothetical protein
MGIQPVFCRNRFIGVDVCADDHGFREPKGSRHVPSCSTPDIQYPAGR